MTKRVRQALELTGVDRDEELSEAITRLSDTELLEYVRIVEKTEQTEDSQPELSEELRQVK